MKAKQGGPRRSMRRPGRKRTGKAVGDSLIEGLEIAVRHGRGEVNVPGYRLAPNDAAVSKLNGAQRKELRARLAHHRAHPDEPGVTLDDIRRRLTRR